ncbi:MAG: alanine racemase [Clostridia bacterium]|nr:alanine racemase [Clostridia bacterium]
MDFLHRTWAQIDHDALINNFNIIRQRVAGSKIMSVVKADGYGHGAVEVAKTLVEAGTDWLAVSNIEEALQLRSAKITKPILVLGCTPAEYASVLGEADITQTVYCPQYAEELSAQAQKAGVTVNAHIKLDTGMHRIGFNAHTEEGVAEAIKACRLDGIAVKGAFTHFASSDMDGDEDGSYTKEQFDLFVKATQKMKEQGVNLELCHCSNSAATLTLPHASLDMVRAGIILYGLRPSKDVEIDGFKPVMTLCSAVSMVKTLKAGQDISYGRTFTAKKDMQVATLPVGYADGYLRGYTGSRVLINGGYGTVIGRVCMDQLMIDVTDLNVKMGDKAVLFGTEGNLTLPVEELAQRADTINYESVCLISKRVTRVHILNGKPVQVTNLLSQGGKEQ